jgi:hypothetical protein
MATTSNKEDSMTASSITSDVLDGREVRSYVRGVAQHNLTTFLAEDNNSAARYSRRSIGPDTLDQLCVAVLGRKSRTRLEQRRYDTWSDLASTRDELINIMARSTRAFKEAEIVLRGGSSILNSLGILQSDGPRIDVLAAKFHYISEKAFEAEYAILEVIAEAALEDPQFFTKVAEVAATRERNEAQRAIEAKKAAEVRAAQDALRCKGEVRGGSYSTRKCDKPGRHLVEFEDGTFTRLCGTHLKSAVYGGVEVGSSMFFNGKQRKVSKVTDTKAKSAATSEVVAIT